MFKLEEPILEQVKDVVEMDGLSFKDCPNRCRNGYYIDPYKHKKILCSYCSDKRKKTIQYGLQDKKTNKSIEEILNLPNSFSGINFSVDTVIPNFMLKNLEEDSVNEVKEKMRELMNDIAIGVVPDYSIMFNLGSKATENNFICPYLLRAYNAGKTVTPMINLLDLCRLRNDMEIGVKHSDGELSYNDLLTKEVCIIVIDTGATRNSINAVKGLMQLRANKDLSTIIITNAWGYYILELCSEDDYKAKNLATLYSVKYNEKYKETEKERTEQLGSTKSNNTMIGMDSESFRNLMSPKKSF